MLLDLPPSVGHRATYPLIVIVVRRWGRRSEFTANIVISYSALFLIFIFLDLRDIWFELWLFHYFPPNFSFNFLAAGLKPSDRSRTPFSKTTSTHSSCLCYSVLCYIFHWSFYRAIILSDKYSSSDKIKIVCSLALYNGCN
jgi:peptidoglycan/LPS O-acetylase OafA/YrhL